MTFALSQILSVRKYELHLLSVLFGFNSYIVLIYSCINAI